MLGNWSAEKILVQDTKWNKTEIQLWIILLHSLENCNQWAPVWVSGYRLLSPSLVRSQPGINLAPWVAVTLYQSHYVWCLNRSTWLDFCLGFDLVFSGINNGVSWIRTYNLDPLLQRPRLESASHITSVTNLSLNYTEWPWKSPGLENSLLECACIRKQV